MADHCWGDPGLVVGVDFPGGRDRGERGRGGEGERDGGGRREEEGERDREGERGMRERERGSPLPFFSTLAMMACKFL